MAAALSFHFMKTIINCFYFTKDYALKLTVYILLIRDHITEHAVNRHVDLLSELIQRDKNHPSVVMWSVASHSVTVRSGNIDSHLKRMMDFTREMDLQKRPVTYVTSSYDKLMIMEDPGVRERN